jgi:small subunit ribosomal protein S7
LASLWPKPCSFFPSEKKKTQKKKNYMPRRQLKKKRSLLGDPVYNSVSIHMLVNRVLKSGKKSIAYRIIYNALIKIGEITNQNPVLVFEEALNNIAPRVQVKPRRRAGAVQMVPRVLRLGDRALATTLRWVLESCEKKSGQSMVEKLKSEILDAHKNTGYAIRKREELHKVALSNAMYAKKPQAILLALGENSTSKTVKLKPKKTSAR